MTYSRKTQPTTDFYNIFAETEILGIIQAIELTQEIPLKYSYKGRGAKIWDNFYQKYIIPRWYRSKNVEIVLLQEVFTYINPQLPCGEKITIIDVGAGNSYPVKEFIAKFHQLDRVSKYVALDISTELIRLSQDNFRKWFPTIKFASGAIDIENDPIPENFSQNPEFDSTNHITNVILHLGVTIGNHQDRIRVFKNFRNSMRANDFLVFTNEIGNNSQWDGKARGGCEYHVEQIYEWIKNSLGIISEDCQLVRKYDLTTDSIVANIKFRQNYMINFSFQGIDQDIQISAGEEMTIWRHHKHQISELIQEIEQSGLKLVHYITNKYCSHIMAICKVES